MEEDTLPKILISNYKKYGDRKVAQRKKVLGTWKQYTWRDYFTQVKHFSLGLLALGLQPGDKVGIIGDNAPEWYWADLAVQSAGGAAVGIYVDSSLDETRYILNHSDSKFVVVKDQEQVDKILAIKADIPKLERLIYWDPKGLRSYEEPLLMSFEQILEMGMEKEAANPSLFEQIVEKGKTSDVAVIAYTSGTTALPKGVMVSHNNLITGIRAALLTMPCRETDNYLSYISPAWLTEHSLGITGALITGWVTNFPERPETVQENIREIGPQHIMYVARLWESLCSKIQAEIADTTSLKRLCYRLALFIGYKIADAYFEKRKPNLLWRGLYPLAYILVFRPLLDKVGLLKAQTCYSGGAPLSPDILRFLRAIGIPLKQGYALTEVPLLAEHRLDDVRLESVGQPQVGVEVRVADSGELIVRSPAVFAGYYKDSEATNKIVIDGWFYTGDAGYIGDDFHVYVWDRAKDLLQLAGGVKYAPAYIEGRLKFSPYIKDAMVVGGKDKPYLAVMVDIDLDNVGRWAQGKRIAYTTFADLSQKPEVSALIQQYIERVNNALPELAKVKKYVLLPKEFDADESELTRTRKLRRAFVMQRYQEMIDSIYRDDQVFLFRAEVKYADGKRSISQIPVAISAVKLGRLS